MKKHLKRKSFSAPPQVGLDIADLINRMQQQLVFLEKKIDTLITQSKERPFEGSRLSVPAQRFPPSSRQDEIRQRTDHRERTLYKAICADCSKECEVPFRPSGDRPVFCKECFSKRKAGGPFKGNRDNRSREGDFVHERHFDKHQSVEHRKFDEKKKPVFKRRKKSLG